MQFVLLGCTNELFYFNILQQQSCNLYCLDVLGFRSMYAFFCGSKNAHSNDDTEALRKHSGDVR